MSVNQVTIIGNLGRDPNLIQTKSGFPMVTLTIATNVEEKNASGLWEKKTTWHNVVTLGGLATSCYQTLKKGRQVYVQGTIEYREYTTKEGIKCRDAQIKASSVVFLGSPRENVQYASNDSQPETSSSSDVVRGLKDDAMNNSHSVLAEAVSRENE